VQEYGEERLIAGVMMLPYTHHGLFVNRGNVIYFTHETKIIHLGPRFCFEGSLNGILLRTFHGRWR